MSAYSGGDRFQQLLVAMAGAASGLDLPAVLHQVVEAAAALVDARYGAVGVIGFEGRLVEFVTTGIDEAAIVRIGHYPEGRGILGLLVVDPNPLRLRDLGDHPRSYGFPPNHPPMTTFLGVPIRVGDEVFGNLYLCEKQNGEEFTEEDEALVVGLAGIAGVAIENARLHSRLQELAVLADRERIARELHDNVIQRLFSVGMGLQATMTGKGEVDRVRVGEAVDELDAVINEVRTTIFDLEMRPADRPSLSASVLRIVDEMTRTAGIEPHVTIDGGLDRVDGMNGEDLVAALREALANVLRHASARTVMVDVEAGEHLTLVVTDDGTGVDDVATRRSLGHGLRNLESRARARSGECTVSTVEGGGTRLTYRVPLRA